MKSLEHIGTTQTADKKATIYTDSRTTLDSLLNNNIHTYLRKNKTESERTDTN